MLLLSVNLQANSDEVKQAIRTDLKFERRPRSCEFDPQIPRLIALPCVTRSYLCIMCCSGVVCSELYTTHFLLLFDFGH